MIKRFLQILLISLFILLLTACQTSSDPDQQAPDQLRGQVLIWHSWDGRKAELLEGMLTKFNTLYPEIKIIYRALPRETIIEEYTNLANSGLAPDMLITPIDTVPDLAKSNYIIDLQPYVVDPLVEGDEDSSGKEINLYNYFDMATLLLRDDGKVYGLPLSLNTQVLYYNKTGLNQVPNQEPPTAEPEEPSSDIGPPEANVPPPIESIEPPKTLQELWAQATSGDGTALPLDFKSASWGIQAFGGTFFNEQGQATLNEGGFANWLNQLKIFQAIPAVTFDDNPDDLMDLFIDGKVVYYVGFSNQFMSLQELMGEAVVGAVQLPGRENNPAGPFLGAEVMVFNRHSSPQNLEAALELARYLSKVDQQRELTLTGELPANQNVRIDPRVSADVSAMIAQSKTSVAISLDQIDKVRDLERLGEEQLQLFLADETTAGAAATWLTKEINTQYGYEPLPREDITCITGEQIELWHAWPEDDSDSLTQIRDNYLDSCPDNTIIIKRIEEPDQLYSSYRAAFIKQQGPALIIVDNDNLAPLVVDNLVKPIDDLVGPKFLQRYMPQTEQSVRYKNKLYGLPISLDVISFYHNTEQVTDLVPGLTDLLIAATSEKKAGISIGFEESYWGISAFGANSDSPMFDEDDRFILEDVGVTDWLDWLENAQSRQGFVFDTDMERLKEMFMNEEIVYLVGHSQDLNELQASLGVDKVGVMLLPNGAPLIEVDAIGLNPDLEGPQADLAFQFAQFMTNVESQTVLLEQTDRLPANVNVNITSTVKANLLKQANLSIVPPNQIETQTAFDLGDTVYQQVLRDDIDPDRATKHLTDLINLVNGKADANQDSEAVDCGDGGELVLWHSWQGAENSAWQVVINNFTDACPEIQLQTDYIPVDDLVPRFSAIGEQPTEGDTSQTGPDLILASHQRLPSLRSAGLLADLTLEMDEDTILSYLPQAVQAIKYRDRVYGIPQSASMNVLYYNPNLVAPPPATLDDLIDAASVDTPVAFGDTFFDLFFGAAAYGCQPCQAGQLFDVQRRPTVTVDDFQAWRNWLYQARNNPSFIFSNDPQELQARFIAGEVAYWLAGPEVFQALQTTLGKENVRLSLLPTGPTGVAKPLLQVEIFMVNDKISDPQKALALQFIRFANSQKQQAFLFKSGTVIPTNKLTAAVNRRLEDETIGAIFIQQIENSVLAPPDEDFQRIETTARLTTTTVLSPTDNNE